MRCNPQHRRNTSGVVSPVECEKPQLQQRSSAWLIWVDSKMIKVSGATID